MKLKSALWFLVSFSLAACAHQEDAPLAQDFSEVEAEEAAIPPSSPLPVLPVEQRLTLDKYYENLVAKDESLRPLQSKEGGPAVAPVASEQSFLRVNSPKDPGVSYVFTLFRGDEHDLVLREKKDCSPDCAYTYAAYEFAGPEYRRLLLSSIFPMSEIGPKVRKIVPKLGRKAGVVPNWPRVEHLRLRQEPEEKTVPLYVLREITKKKREELTYFDVGTLRWDPKGQQFAFNARPQAKSLGALDGAKEPSKKKRRGRR
jgi:hypothetical protein